jgi:hypothetical protein
VEPFYLLLFIAGLLIADLTLRILRLLWRFIGLPIRRLRYQRQIPFLIPAERRALLALEAATDADYRIFVRVSLETVITVKEGTPMYRLRRARRYLLGSSIDFLICARAGCYPLCAIWLLPKSRPSYRLQRRVKSMQRLCQQVGLSTLTLHEAGQYDIDQLQRQLATELDATIQQPVAKTLAAAHQFEEPLKPLPEEQALLNQLSNTLREPYPS